MDTLFEQAEKEMKELKQPYVGSHHFFLAYLKNNKNNSISYDTFREYVIKVIGSCYKESPYTLYTPYLQKIKKSIYEEREALKKIVTDSDSIVYNILLTKGENIEAILSGI